MPIVIPYLNSNFRYVSYRHDQDAAPGAGTALGRQERTDEVSRHVPCAVENYEGRRLQSSIQRVSDSRK